MIAGFLAARRTLIYPFAQGFDARIVRGPSEVLALTAADGTELLVWLRRPAPGRATVLHFTGNGGATPVAADHLAPLAEAGFGVAVLNYRGAGGAPGVPSEAAILADALTVYDALPDLVGQDGPPILHGSSLGAAVAVAVAAERPAAALVLEVPFAELCAPAQAAYPFLPACLIMWDERWDSLARAPSVGAPALVVGAERDEVIPAEEARRLHAALPNAEFVLLPNARHNQLAGAIPHTLRFLADQGL